MAVQQCERWLLVAGSIVLALTTSAAAEPKANPPILLVDGGGPSSLVTTVTFAPDGKSLLVAGWDKVVRTWRLGADGQFRLDPAATYRVPLGPGLEGAINAMALSSDGKWLAVGGQGKVRGGAGFQHPGYCLPSKSVLTEEMQLDMGVIHVFNTADQSVRSLRGHPGPIFSLAFEEKADAPVLASMGPVWGKQVGSVRVWDVGRGRTIATSADVPEPKSRPAIVVRRFGQAQDAIDVGLALGDGQMRSWRVNDGVAIRAARDGRFNNSLVLLPQGNQLLAASLNGRQGSVQIWEFNEQGALSQRQEAALRGGANPGEILVPRAVGLTAAPATRSDVAAVASFVMQGNPPTPQEVRLSLVSLRPAALGQNLAETRLWRVSGSAPKMPAVATAPGGEWLAVSGDEGHAVHVYSVRELLRGNPTPQRLQSVGRNWRQVAFTTRNGHTGLLLGTMRKSRPGNAPWNAAADDVVFDLQDERFSAPAEGWAAASHRVVGWTARSENLQDRVAISVARENQQPQRALLPNGEMLSDFALRSPRPARPPQHAALPAVLAVASHQNGQPQLRLYNAETGEQFRELTGHSERIASIAFSPDGRFLVSVAEDQTVRMWSLGDIDAVLGRHGMLPGGMQVEAVNGGLKITEIADPGRLPGFEIGDMIVGGAVNGENRTWRSPREFFDTFWLLPRGQNVDIERLRQGAQANLRVRLVQGIDERKPLLSFFFPRLRPGAVSWMAWSPLGPYEASGRDVEKHLGWHFNSDEPGKPTRYARLEQYRDTYYTRELVKQVFDEGKLPSPPLAKPPAGISLILGGKVDAEHSSDDQLLLRTPPDVLQVVVHGFPDARIKSVSATIGGQPALALQRQLNTGWSAALAGRQWKRGDWPVHCVVRTDEVPPREFPRTIQVRYSPLPPKITPEWPREVTEGNKAPLSVRVESSAGEPVVVRWRQQGPWQERSVEQGGKPFREELKLTTGENVVEVEAFNDGAPRENESLKRLETTRSRLVCRLAEKQKPPTIAITQIKNGAAPGTVGTAVTTEQTVSWPSIIVEGSVSAEKPLTRVTWKREEVAEERNITTIGRDNDKAWTFKQSQELQPGPQQFVISATAENCDVARTTLNVFYRPPLPDMVNIVRLTPGTLIERELGIGAENVVIEGSFGLPPSNEPFDAEILVNGAAAAIKPVIDRQRQTVRAEVPLTAKDNRLAIRLKNQWGATADSAVQLVTYQRLPRISDVAGQRQGASALMKVVATVESPADLPLTRLEVAGAEVSLADAQPVTEEGKKVWRVTVNNVAPAAGARAIEVAAWNDHGRCQRAVDIPPLAAQGAPPRIILASAPEAPADTPQWPLHFEVRGRSAIREVVVLLNKAPQKLDIQKRQLPGEVQWDVSAQLELQRGMNDIQVRAVGDGGSSFETRKISYVRRPRRVEIVSIEESQQGQTMKAVPLADGTIGFRGTPTGGVVILTGKIHWGDELPPAPEESPYEIQAWINGFRQRASIKPQLDKQMGEQWFTATLVLGQSRNQGQLALEGLPNEAGSRLNFSVDCTNPEKGRRLHLLIVGVDKDELEIRKRALEAVKARKDQGNFVDPPEVPNYKQVEVHQLPSYVSKDKVLKRLLDLKQSLDLLRLNAAEPLNDVVMMYYEGGELSHSPQGDEFFLATSVSRDDPGDLARLRSRQLSLYFNSMLGAHLVLLDVSVGQDAPKAAAAWEQEARSALLYYAWLPNADRNPRTLRLIDELSTIIRGGVRLRDIDAELRRRTRGNVVYGGVLPESLQSFVLQPGLP